MNVPRVPPAGPLLTDNPPQDSSAAPHDNDDMMRFAAPISTPQSLNPNIDGTNLFEVLQVPQRALNIRQNRMTYLSTAVEFPSPMPLCPALIPSLEHSDTRMTSDAESNDEIPTPENLSRKRVPSDDSDGFISKRCKNDSGTSMNDHKSLSPSPRRLRSQKKILLVRSVENAGDDDIAEHAKRAEHGTVAIEIAGQQIAAAPIDKAANPPSPTSSLSLETEPENEERLNCIRIAISYTRDQLASGSLPAVTDYFSLNLAPPSEALTLLRRAYHNGLATLISSSRAHETYSIGIPPGPASKKFGGLNPQWWVGLSRAEMKVGPFRDEADIRKAENDVISMLKRKQRSEKSGRLHIEKKIVAEGLRRQENGLQMWDEEDKGRKTNKKRENKRQQYRAEDMDQGDGEGDEEINEERQTPTTKKQKCSSRNPAQAERKRPTRRVRFVDDIDDGNFDPNGRK